MRFTGRQSFAVVGLGFIVLASIAHWARQAPSQPAQQPSRHTTGARQSSNAAHAAHRGQTVMADPTAEKVGAGFLFVSQPSRQVLLLRRVSNNNGNKWGLPGGNVEPQDGGNLMATATREGIEELGHLPEQYDVQGSILTRRGKRGQKHFTVFVADVPDVIKESYAPRLNLREHSEWRWVSLASLMPLRHEAPPQGTMQFQVREATGRFPSGVESGTEGLDLHPIVEKLVSQDYRDECLRLSGVRQP